MTAPTAVISRRADLQEKNTRIMLVMPVVLILSTYAAFKLFDAWWRYPAGYLAGFAFYWIFWCLVFPVYILGGVRPVLSLFREGTPSIRRLGWKAQLLLWLWIAFPLFTIFIPRAAGLGVLILGVSVLIGVVIGVTEELLWRGVYVRLFPNSTWMSVVYPSIMFGLWHISPQAVRSSSMPGGVFSFVFYAVLLGLAYAYVACKTGSIRWVTVSHVVHDALGLGALAYSAWLLGG
jgi:uncharacterized protein